MRSPEMAPISSEPQPLGRITDLASRVLADNKLALEWLLEPNLATDNRPLVELLDTKAGYKRIENLLLRIEYGVLA